MKTRMSVFALAGVLGACGGGVPVELRLDEIVVDLSVEDTVGDLSTVLGGSGLLPKETTAIPERWPAELPDACFEIVIETDPDDGGRLDLTPGPDQMTDLPPELVEINNGYVERIEVNALYLRVEQNTLNVPLPPVEVQIADLVDADPKDRRAWRTVGRIGPDEPSAGCQNPGANPIALEAEEIGDFKFAWERGGESFLNNQLADERCVEEGDDPNACKELSLRIRSRLVYDTAEQPMRPRGRARVRLILAATFFIDPF